MKMSKGNMKLPYANVSMTPIKSCKGCAEICGKDCYAMKAYRQYPSTRAAWDHNLEQAVNDMPTYFAEIESALKKYKQSFFRWHVAGDILDDMYFIHMCQIACKFPHIKFLAFTKQYNIINDEFKSWPHQKLPDNLTIVFSAWPGLAMDNPYGFPVAWMHDGTNTDTIPSDAIHCPGLCENCGMCWELPKLQRGVVFNKH